VATILQLGLLGQLRGEFAMARKKDLQERVARIETEARRLARSGLYQGFSAIEMALMAQGYRDVAIVFANRWTQSELDRLCDRARNCAPSIVPAMGADWIWRKPPQQDVSPPSQADRSGSGELRS
jgi:hypothetical protein